MNWFDVTLFGSSFVTLFVIMDPPGIIPLYLSFTGGRPKAVRKRMAWQAATVAFCLSAIAVQLVADGVRGFVEATP